MAENKLTNSPEEFSFGSMSALDLRTIRSPKLKADRLSAKRRFPYYAGFSEAFTADFLMKFAAPSSTVLDPWNGSGTTTSVASRLGHTTIGVDLNPVMTLVSIARSATNEDFEAAFLVWSAALEFGCLDTPNFSQDPLSEWLSRDACRFLRPIIDYVLGRSWFDYIENFSNISQTVDKLSPSNAIVAVAIFTSLKTLTKKVRHSNPTWTKPHVESIKPRFNREKFVNLIENALENFQELDNAGCSGYTSFICGNAEDLPLPPESVDLVLTSPPYCTRIDYAVSTLIELATLGLSSANINLTLRQKMLGSTAIKPGPFEIKSEWGAECGDLLRFVRSHPSAGSQSYYYKNFLQYFDGLHRSIIQIEMVLRHGGRVAMVLQSSFYKERRINLAFIVCEMAKNIGLTEEFVASFPAKTSMAHINTKSAKYRKEIIDSEELVIFRKA